MEEQYRQREAHEEARRRAALKEKRQLFEPIDFDEVPRRRRTATTTRAARRHPTPPAPPAPPPSAPPAHSRRPRARTRARHPPAMSTPAAALATR